MGGVEADLSDARPESKAWEPTVIRTYREVLRTSRKQVLRTLENKFCVTDFKNDVMVVYKGALPATFREGDMAAIGGFLADHKNPSCFVGTSVAANHEISPDRWLGETNMDRAVSMNMIETDEDFEYTKMK